ncbi:importin-alpha export receptor [Spiromyces aspiralis]|uniref:Importin-alpha export receptor n=1 Tax=Spiromyces aspiralis TaxID=68401 RepID=A0ACC1HPQ7_9FUNG|nr:importin-alpha export receptor [Spiromyces aspiralis]
MQASIPSQTLANVLRETLSQQDSLRKKAEQQLAEMEKAPHFVSPLVELMKAQGDPTVSFAAALYFKNYIKRLWPQDENTEDFIVKADRDVIKSEIVGLMVSLDPRLQLQVSEAMSVIADNDFPANWPNLIHNLISKLSRDNYKANNAVLQAAHTVFKRWRSEFRSDLLFSEIKFVLEQFCQPYMDFFFSTHDLIQAHAQDKPALDVLLKSLSLLCDIYYDLNCQDLPEFFEDNMPQFMDKFHFYLTYSNPLVESDDEDSPGLLEELKAVICEILTLYAQRYEEDFKQLQQFVQTVWNMMTSMGPEQKYDTLVCKGINFLRTVVKNPRHKDLFSAPETLSLICQKIVLPNMALSTADEELFEDDPMQYVQRDSDGSEVDTRRKAASDLVRGLLEQFNAPTTQAMSQYVQNNLRNYAANPAQNWKDKDIAIFMVFSVAIISSNHLLGVTKTNDQVNISDFYQSHVVGHLKDVGSDTNEPILKADAIKYVLNFRNQLSLPELTEALGMLASHLAHPNAVVSTYAAIAIERILVLKKDDRLVFGPHDIQDKAPHILHAIFSRLEAAPSPQKLAENPHYMKTIMRVIIASRTNITPIAPIALDKLAAILQLVSTNPSNPQFNHFLFESIGSLARFSCAATPQAIATFESKLFPIFQFILQSDVAEFMPYVFQILAQLLSIHTPEQGLPEAYVSLLSPLLNPALWELAGNRPALVRLLQSYLQTGATQLVQNNFLNPILGIFQKLVASRANDHHAFNLLIAITLFVPLPTLKSYFKTIMTLLLTRLQSSRTAKFTRNFCHYIAVLMSLGIDKDASSDESGVGVLISTTNSIQPDLFMGVLKGVLIDAIPTVLGPLERKTTATGFGAFATSRFALDSPQFLAAVPAVLKQVVTLIEDPAVRESKAKADASKGPTGGSFVISHDQEDLDSLEFEDAGYQTSFTRLATLGEIKLDPTPTIINVPLWLAQRLKANAADPKMQQAVQALDSNVQAVLQRYISLS